MAAPSSGEVDGKPAAITRHIVCSKNNKPPSVNAFQRCTDFFDENIRLFRTSITITAAVGVLLIARSIRVSHRFRTVSDIPDEFISKNMKLYGSFVEVKENPIHIIVEHTPILQVQRFWRGTNGDTNEVLPIHLAGVELHEGSRDYLVRRLTAHPKMRFHMLQVNQSNGLDCLVELTKRKFPFRKVSLNEELLRHGLAKVAPLTGLQDQTLNIRLTQRLLAAEMQAERKSRGLWTQDCNPTTLDVVRARWTSMRPALAPWLEVLRKTAMLPQKAVRGLWGVLMRRRKTGRDG